MARERKITREVTSTKVTLMVVNINTAEVENKTLEIAETFKSEDKIIPYIEKKNLLEEGYKAVDVVDREEVKQIYGMLEQDFIRLAKPMTEDRKFVD